MRKLILLAAIIAVIASCTTQTPKVTDVRNTTADIAQFLNLNFRPYLNTLSDEVQVDSIGVVWDSIYNLRNAKIQVVYYSGDDTDTGTVAVIIPDTVYSDSYEIWNGRLIAYCHCHNMAWSYHCDISWTGNSFACSPLGGDCGLAVPCDFTVYQIQSGGSTKK